MTSHQRSDHAATATRAAARARYAQERRLRAAEELTEGVEIDHLVAVMVGLALKPKPTAADFRSQAHAAGRDQ